MLDIERDLKRLWTAEEYTWQQRSGHHCFGIAFMEQLLRLERDGEACTM